MITIVKTLIDGVDGFIVTVQTAPNKPANTFVTTSKEQILASLDNL